MLVFKHKADLKEHLDQSRAQGKKIGFVPTMGALHQGHLSLVLNSARENDLTLVSIFVNPTQFDNPEDLKNYPSSLEKDLDLLESTGKEIVVFTPNTEEMYANKVISGSFDFDGLEHQMEGRFRPGHFDGVGTIVKALLELAGADRAYFGEKDFQQLQIIKKLAEKENISTEIVGCPILREANGLAMSSRNERLTPELRNQASFIYKTIVAAREQFGMKNAEDLCEWVENQFNTIDYLKLEYVEIADEATLKPVKSFNKNDRYRLFIAVFANEIRLIDNIALN
ncbi:pantoate--beta-alanine ligase [Robertkochia marina]|uniref:Pantothenate synthetase n=1 Tax=Robertkochia marina TaxID=1227945 RepID=A0A4S3M5B9_9FLAO|nr:pantoate--beta-alanine ligase [Robertkochia marina]THD69531.1 pantoate--beta-alanine ligase [Robertkochia marina]TRZ47210.1 pantoate--beta-alanine ligase [Robertkochia marina]